MRILILCAGNIGRSPLAEALVRHRLAQGLGVEDDELEQVGVTVVSAGTDTPAGHPASHRSVAFAAERGLDLTGHTATQLTAAVAEAADVILCMDRSQLAAVDALGPGASSAASLLAGPGREIPDPHHQSDDFFREVALQIEEAVIERVPELLDGMEPIPPRKP